MYNKHTDNKREIIELSRSNAIEKSIPQKGSQRDSSFELMRIISMLLIIAHHFAYHRNPSYSIFAVAALFILCVIIDLARQRFLEKPFMRLFDRYSASWLKPLQAIGRTVQKRLFENSAESE